MTFNAYQLENVERRANRISLNNISKALTLETSGFEQGRFRQEVAKWEAEGNELVRLAVVIRDILVTMTDFTQGEVTSHWSRHDTHL